MSQIGVVSVPHPLFTGRARSFSHPLAPFHNEVAIIEALYAIFAELQINTLDAAVLSPVIRQRKIGIFQFKRPNRLFLLSAPSLAMPAIRYMFHLPLFQLIESYNHYDVGGVNDDSGNRFGASAIKCGYAARGI